MTSCSISRLVQDILKASWHGFMDFWKCHQICPCKSKNSTLWEGTERAFLLLFRGIYQKSMFCPFTFQIIVLKMQKNPLYLPSHFLAVSTSPVTTIDLAKVLFGKTALLSSTNYAINTFPCVFSVHGGWMKQEIKIRG